MKRRSRWILKGGKLKAHILEEDVLNEVTIRLWLEYRIRVWRVRERIPGMGRLSEPGIPDLIGWIPEYRVTLVTQEATHTFFPRAVPLYIECKRPGGARRTAQIQFIEEAKRDGCVAFFAESWADVVREMEAQCGLKLRAA